MDAVTQAGRPIERNTPPVSLRRIEYGRQGDQNFSRLDLANQEQSSGMFLPAPVPVLQGPGRPQSSQAKDVKQVAGPFEQVSALSRCSSAPILLTAPTGEVLSVLSFLHTPS